SFLGPSELWLSRTHGQKLVISASHDDYPALLAEALDRLQGTGWQIAPAAELLGVSTSQLIGLFKKAPAALVVVNKHRLAIGLPGLK
ncbi:MAG: peptide chain release factor-like protein, partial [Planctomycetota bacterium]